MSIPLAIHFVIHRTKEGKYRLFPDAQRYQRD